jgi:hypothetical protein
MAVVAYFRKLQVENVFKIANSIEKNQKFYSIFLLAAEGRDQCYKTFFIVTGAIAK